jgi:hypothetical protein
MHDDDKDYDEEDHLMDEDGSGVCHYHPPIKVQVAMQVLHMKDPRPSQNVIVDSLL